MSPVSEPIAVVGCGCRFPGDSTSPSKLWELLRSPRDLLQRIERFNPEGFYHVDGHHHGTSNVRDAYFLSQNPRVFDAQFFSISGSEADAIDPQQRLLLETVYESVEAAGMTIESLQGSQTAVFVGIMTDDYAEVMHHDSDAIPTYAATGSSRCILANRISYFFDWHGPSMSIDTACSSSLVAVHQAVQTLRSGECSAAVAAGANLIFGPKMFIAESNLSMLSPTGRSRMWDADADGYARGEGIAAIVMKTLSAAIADGDHIECIIRETGVNQDGRTPGITMPSAIAQCSLIRDTYARAGLNLGHEADRPQYFEAHGTGTRAGDPQEAQAIHRAFFPKDDVLFPETEHVANKASNIYVGSIKTIIGHTEGTAGLAGLMKASLAIQHKTIPPNMHFKTLNPHIEPFYGDLKILTEAQAWPTLPQGVPRRASVNSFGFGGTNAHAIVESYEPAGSHTSQLDGRRQAVSAIPFTFSATSERSLGALLSVYLTFLREKPDTDARALSWSLSRRSALSFRISFPTSNVNDLTASIRTKLEEKKSTSVSIGTKAITKNRGIFGIFTGQGAQWPSMGRTLVIASPIANAIIDELENSLKTLPLADRPTWSLKGELFASSENSRISEGIISQPLCTAIQIMLIDLLRQAGIKFNAVVGHSSGEIAAAYAAGFISSTDAVRIAYFRGVHTKLARGPTGETGAMLAVGTSMEDADEICQLPAFKGRINLAASNSSASVTLSGNADAIQEVKDIFEDESKFARTLKVDTAYHSAHMLPCSSPYMESLRRCKIQIQTPPESATKWFSSVLEGAKVDASISNSLQSDYWCDNMLKPVLFSQALETALAEIAVPAIALEIGPHPALKGPASLTIEEIVGNIVPYSGILSRGKDAIEAFSESIGFVWNHLGPSVVDFVAYDYLFNKGVPQILLKDLPTYAWDHERKFWSESRSSRIARSRETPPHELLGVRSSDDIEGEYSWHNYIKPSQIPWLRGHQIQGQILFPAAGFIIMGIEASKALVDIDDVRLVEIYDAVIHRAMSIYDEVAGVETVVKLSNVINQEDAYGEKSITFDFTCSCCLNKDVGNFTTMARGRSKVIFGQSSLLTLPQRPLPVGNLIDQDVELFYSKLALLGYNYEDMFKGITVAREATDVASGIINITKLDEGFSPYMFHPATLDVAFQTVLAAVGVEGRLWSLHVPMRMDRLRLNPLAIPEGSGTGTDLPFDATLISFSTSKGLYGDVDLYEETGVFPILQIEGLHVAPISPATVQNDRQVFAKTVWDVAEPDAQEDVFEYRPSELATTGSLMLERICLFHLKKLHESIDDEARGKCDEHRIKLLQWIANAIELISQERHSTCKKEWLEDTSQDVESQIAHYEKSFGDVRNVTFVAERLISFVKGEISLIEEIKKNQMLEHFYDSIPGLVEYKTHLCSVIRQITHRYPHMEILEVGAGTGSVSTAVLQQIGKYYLSYTYADTFDTAIAATKELFEEDSSKLRYKYFDNEQDPIQQGFTEESYDLIIAPNVVHIAGNVDQGLQNLRKLLKPGGYLVLLEMTNNQFIQSDLLFAGIPHWWAVNDGDRQKSSLISQTNWNSRLRKSGFSGVDTSTPEASNPLLPFSVMVSQAIDTQISLLRQPLSQPGLPSIEDLLIVGGNTLPILRLVEALKEHLSPLCRNFTIVHKLEDLDESMVPSKVTVLCLTELDAPLFKTFTPEKLKGVQILLDSARNVLWVTKGSEGEQPHANMMVSIGRCLIHEMPDLRFQSIDLGMTEKPNSQLLAEALLRIHISGSWKTSMEPDQRLWTFERELAISNGVVLIPRYTANEGSNDRYNSFKRLIQKNVSLDETTVSIIPGNTYELQEHRVARGKVLAVQGDNMVTVRIDRSVLLALKVKWVGYLYLIEGIETASQKKVFAMSQNQRSTISVPRSWTIPSNDHNDRSGHLLVAMANELLARLITLNLTNADSLLVHEPDSILASTLKRQVYEKGMEILITASTLANKSTFYHINPSMSDRTIRTIIPKQTTVFVDFSRDRDPSCLGRRISKCLPQGCKEKNPMTFFSTHAYAKAGAREGVVSGLLQKSYDKAKLELSKQEIHGPVEEIALRDVPKRSVRTGSIEIINWKTNSDVPVRVRCAEDEIQFHSNMTYFLIGMTGELGLSLTQWMVKKGARYFALTSRNPKINSEWLEMMEAKGAVIKTFSMDITDRNSLLTVHKAICETLPPIAGVANAAMTIADGIFTNISYETMQGSFAPKVDGSIFLDELFIGKDLEFFILFSSITCITGNIGQSSYAAGNAFMTSLAKGRRKRSLVGSVMNLAGIFGLGYVSRAEKGVLDRLKALGFSNLREWDFHQNFAEAVLIGHPDSGLDAELSAGLLSYDIEKDTNVPAWVHVPKFARYRLFKNKGDEGDNSDNSKTSVRARLIELTTKEEVHQTILDGLLATLYHKLNLSVDDNISCDSSVIELGVDSLVAIDMRSWFTKELDIDMSVLKLLGGATINDLVTDAVVRISPDLIPNVVTMEAASDSAIEIQPENTDSDSGIDGSTDNELHKTSTGDTINSSKESDLETESSKSSVDADLDTDSMVSCKKVNYIRTTKMGYASTRFWFLRQYMRDPTTFNCGMKWLLNGRIRENDSDRTIIEIGKRHEAFRTAFFANAERMNEPSQGVLAESVLRLERKKISDVKQVDEEYKALLEYSFDLERGDVIRIMLLTLTPTSHFLLICYHHIAMDGFSFNVLMVEINRLYSGPPLPHVAMQFTDFVEKQRKDVENGEMADDLKFWREQFPKFPDTLPLFPVARVNSRIALTEYDFEETSTILDSQISAKIRDSARRHKSTTFHFFLATLKIFLFRLLDIEEICIGVADAGRSQTNTVGTLGLLLNLLPLQFTASKSQKFGNAVIEARNKAYAALGHSRIPFDVLLEEFNVPRSSTHSPLFQIFMDYRHIPLKSPKILGVKADAGASYTPGRTAYDLILDIRDVAGSDIHISFRTQKYLYSQDATQTLFKSYMRLVEHFVSNPLAETTNVPLFDPLDVKAAAKLGRGKSLSIGIDMLLIQIGPSMYSTWPATISQRIDNVSAGFAQRLAVKDGLGNVLTYDALSKRVHCISSSLLDAGAGHKSKIAVFQEPTSDWVCTLLAIWRVGGIYVPLEVTNTLPRLAIMVNDCKPDVIVCHESTAADVPALGPDSSKIINVSALAKSKMFEIRNQAKPDSPAAILYTSGSTGTPKGIILRHSSIRNEMEGYSKQWEIGQQTVLQQSAYTFDFSLDQMLSALSNGGTVYVVQNSDRRDPVKIARLIETEGITYTKATPSEYSSWIQHGSTSLSKATLWRLAFGGGEPLTSSLKREFRSLKNPNLRLFNSYGPGEITISCTKMEVHYQNDADVYSGLVQIGMPLPNYAMYVVDKNLEPLPAGVTGEIVIGGLGPAIGYLNNEDLNKKKFIQDVYSSLDSVSQGSTTVYRSGDLGRLQPDGSFIFEGRIDGDTQVKIRGIRVELEDIESTIVQASHGVLSKVVASVRGKPQFIVAHAEFAITYPESEQAQYLKTLLSRLPLPQCMRPAMIISLKAIPLNTHSKIDRLAVKSLTLPQTTIGNSDKILTTTERTLKNVWLSIISKDVAETIDIDGDANFFHLGGNSLLLVKLQACIRETFDTAVPLMKLFESSTLSSMATSIEESVSAVAIDWDVETALVDNSITTMPMDDIPQTLPSSGEAGLSVILTGATGFLGRNILESLVRDERISTIHCIAVRQKTDESCQMHLKSDKIVIHKGDLAEPLLGLSHTSFKELANNADVIIHSGANRSFWDYYQILQGPNLSATKVVTHLAQARKIPVHFISSGGVLSLSRESQKSEKNSMSAFKPPSDGSMGYVATKWASEVYLEHAAHRLKIPVYIHRVTPPEVENHEIPEALVEEFLKIAIDTKSLPSGTGWRGNFDLIPVRPLSQEICNAALTLRTLSSGNASAELGPTFLHYPSEVTVRIEEVSKLIDANVGKHSFERMLPHKWVGQAKEMGISYHFASQDITLGSQSFELFLKR